MLLRTRRQRFLADELHGLLRSLGQYKRGGGSDCDRFLALWSGERWRYERVTDEIYLSIARPTLSILGGIQPERLDVLSGEDGLRTRWLLARADRAPEHGDPFWGRGSTKDGIGW